MTTPKTNVYLYLPNLIGYVRIVFLLMFIVLTSQQLHLWSIILYTISCFLDALDGYAARYFNQCSKFGSVLDMVTDRSSTSVLLVYLSYAIPSCMPLFQALLALDICSHYFHMYASLISGASSHKIIAEKDSSSWLRAYYTSRLCLFSVCAGNELFFICLYVWSFASKPITDHGYQILFISVTILFGAVCAFKQFLNVIQLIRASNQLVDLEFKDAPLAATNHKRSK